MLHPVVRAAIKGCPCEQVAGPPCGSRPHQLQTIATLRQPPVYAAAQPVWYQCKALELAVTFLVQPEEELFCTRQQRLAQERVEQVIFLLKQNLADAAHAGGVGEEDRLQSFLFEPDFFHSDGPDHHAIPAAVAHGAGGGIAAGGRAQRHRSGLEVGYNSLSHFSAAFHEAFGCCPGLYPLRTPTQRKG